MAEHGGIVIHPDDIVDELEVDEESLDNLSRWIDTELKRADGSRSELRLVWESNLRLYEAVAEQLRRNIPIENASNIEIPLGAIAADSVYAQIINTIFQIEPLITVREVGETGEFVENIKALQRFVDVLARKIRLRPAAENAILDDVKLGTGILYTRWEERRKKTAASSEVISRGPIVQGVAIEDFFVPGGACDDLDRERWVALRYNLTENELRLRERDLEWEIESAQETATQDRVRQLRERLGRHDGFGSRKGNENTDRSGGRMFEIYDIYCYWDIDNDGIDEDLLVTWDKGSRTILKIGFNPYDRRPFSVMRYQLREYLFYGLGVVEMLRPFQRGATNLYNHWVDNSLLANTRFWVGKHGAIPNNQMRVWPNRYLAVANPATDIIPHQMADTYPSAPAAIQQTISFAERRVGLPEVSGNRPGGVLGSRTPGITALSVLQKTNERFGPAFESARTGVAGAVRQAIFRYQERLLAGDFDVENDIRSMLGDERGDLVIALLKDARFDDTVAVELTASNAQVNKEADRQNWLLLMQQVITLGERLVGLAQIMDSQEVGPVTKNVAGQLAEVARELLERVYRSFDQVRDPRQLLIDMNAAIEEAEAQQPPDAMAQLGGLLGGMINQQEVVNGAAGDGTGAGVQGPPMDEADAFPPGALG